MFITLQKHILLFMLIVAFISMNAFAVSPAQIEQFKKMPRAQQQALAKSMGYSLADLEKQMKSGVLGEDDTTSNNTQFFERGTKFDRDGNPIEDETLEEDEEEFDFNKELKPFGYDVFANEPTTFSPITDIAIPADYIIGTGDKINLQAFGKESFDYDLTVSREGKLLIPEIGSFSVAGLSFSGMKAFLTNRIKERIVGVDVIVNINELRSMRIFVLGDAYKPGPYTLSSLSSITHAIFAAGGISDIGSLRNIQLKRAGKLIATFDLYDLLIKGDSSNDLLLQSGDVVFVGSVGDRVYVDGEVKRPAIYEISNNETFADVMKMAGGLLPSAYLKSTVVERFSSSNYRTAIDLDLTDSKAMQQKAFAGDRIKIKKTTEFYEESITLIGALTRPGKYQWKQGQKVADIIPAIDSHLLRHADLNYALIIREVDIVRNVEVLQFSLAKAILDTASKDNVVLQPNDKVIVFSSATTLKEEKIFLDNLAQTQEDLFLQEKKLAKIKYDSDKFWKKYGEDALNNINSNRIDYLEEKEQEKSRLINESIARITGGEFKEELDERDMALFSRQRLLIPIIKKLKKQSASGMPMQLVEIDGEVKFPGVYPLSKNARVADLIMAAGGTNESAYLERAEITRNEIEDIQARKVSYNIKLSAALNGSDEDNLLLKSKDRLNIHKIPSWSQNHVVELRGEFVFPGKYTIRRGESLSDIIKKAGGLTEFAHAEGSVFSREKLKDLERENIIRLSANLRMEMASKSLTEGVDVSYDETNSLLEDMIKIEPVGRLVIELPKVIEDNNYDVLLEGGDVLYVPTKKNSINVIGQVQVTSSHMYNADMDAHEYITQSGGMKIRADEDRVYIISANGSIKMLDSGNWFAGTSSLKPGDTIVVPLDSQYMNNLSLWSSVTQIIYNSAVAIAAISGI